MLALLRGWKWPIVFALVMTGAALAFTACPVEEEVLPTPPPPEVTPTPPPPPPAPGPLKIGLLTDFTGALSTFGPEQQNAAELAIDHINAAGGVLGQPVELVIADSGTLPDIGVAEARRLVDIEKVHAIVGSLASGVSLPIAESVTVPSRILQITPASTSPALTVLADNDYLFRTPISDAAQGVVLAKLVQDLGFTSVCTMFVNNAYGQGLTEVFTENFTAAGFEVTAQIPHTVESAPTYASELEQCTEAGPEALVAISYPVGQAEVYLDEALERGLVTNFVFVDATKDDEMFAKLGWDLFDGMKGTVQGALPPSDFTLRFDEAYVAKYGAIYIVGFVREAYDAVMIIAMAAEAAGSVDSTAIRDKLRDVANAPGEPVAAPPDGIAAAFEAIRAGTDINYDGASGSVEFDANGDVLIGAIEVWQVDAANQTLVPIQHFRVDLGKTPPEVTEIVGGGAQRFDSTADRLVYIDPLLLRGSRTQA